MNVKKKARCARRYVQNHGGIVEENGILSIVSFSPKEVRID